MVKNAIIVIDATPFRQWYEAHYILPLGRKRDTKQQLAEDPVLSKKRCRSVMAKYLARQRFAKVEPALEEQFASGRLLGEFHINIHTNQMNSNILSDDHTFSDPKICDLISRFEKQIFWDMIMLS